MKTVDRGSKEKLYVQIYSIILDKIENGEWPSGTQIPPEDELCRIYDVSKVTVREAIHELVREGFLRRQQGKGTYVEYPGPYFGIVMRTRLFENDVHGEEVKVRKEILEQAVRETPETVKTILTTEESVYYMHCRKIVDESFFDEEFFISLFLLPEIREEDVSERSLYDLIEAKGSKKIFRVQQTMEITSVTKDTAPVLAKQEGTPALLIRRVFISQDGSPIAYSRLVGCGGKDIFRMEFERIK